MYVIVYDFGTSAVKTCLFEISSKIRLICHTNAEYGLYILENGGAEQDTEEWWDAITKTTTALFDKTDIKPSEISGISFCTQMQGVVLVDKHGNALRRPMSFLDTRAVNEFKEGLGKGLIKVSGCNVFKLFRNLYINKTASMSVKDPVYKYKWVEKNEPDIFAKVYKWLDVKDYLILRCTGNFIATEDSAFGTFLYDIRPETRGWSDEMCNILGVTREHLPEVINSTDVAGKLSAKAAADLGLAEGTPVFGGGGDASLIGVGAGAVEAGDTHIYSGTSGWVGTITKKPVTDVTSMIAAMPGADPEKYVYFAEMETAGKCLEWVRDHLAKDEIGIYINTEGVSSDFEERSSSLYSYMMESIKDVEPGSGGVLFAPWLHGNRCPFEDSAARGMFIGIGLETGKTELIHAVLEGVFYHLRWMLESQGKRVKTSKSVRFVGGGALSDVSCQMLADIIGRPVETVEYPQNVGSVGACAVAAVGLGLIPSIDSIKDFVQVSKTFEPDKEKNESYKPYFKTFKKLYSANKGIFAQLT